MEEVLQQILRKYPAGKKDALISLLQEIQEQTGYLTEESISKVSSHMNIPLNKIYGVATFYDQFRFWKKGKYHIQICNGTACYINRSTNLRKELEKIPGLKCGQTSPDGKFSFEIVNCLGACANSPVMIINGKAYGNIVPGTIRKILSGLIEANE
jgi:NADH-quinone oxidoreductase subunit E